MGVLSRNPPASTTMVAHDSNRNRLLASAFRSGLASRWDSSTFLVTVSRSMDKRSRCLQQWTNLFIVRKPPQNKEKDLQKSTMLSQVMPSWVNFTTTAYQYSTIEKKIKQCFARVDLLASFHSDMVNQTKKRLKLSEQRSLINLEQDKGIENRKRAYLVYGSM